MTRDADVQALTFDQFANYVHFKAFDVIGDGQYRKFLVKCRDNSEMWAINIFQDVQSVNSLIKQVSTEINKLLDIGCIKIHRICSEITTCINPPVRQKMGWHICNLSGMRSDNCVEISRSGRAETFAVVNAKYTKFILMLWFVSRLDHIIKIITKHWLEQNKNHFENESLDKLEKCQKFQKEYTDMKNLYHSFIKAHTHVLKSFEFCQQSYNFDLQSSTKNKSGKKRKRRDLE